MVDKESFTNKYCQGNAFLGGEKTVIIDLGVHSFVSEPNHIKKTPETSAFSWASAHGFHWSPLSQNKPSLGPTYKLISWAQSPCLLSPWKNAIPSPSAISLPFLIHSSLLGSRFLCNHFLPRSYLPFQVLDRPHSPTRHNALSSLLCFCLTTSLNVSLYDMCPYYRSHQSVSFWMAGSQPPWFAYPRHNFVHTGCSASASWVKNHGLGFWIILGKRFKHKSILSPTSTKCVVSLACWHQFWGLGTVCPWGRCHCGPSCSLDSRGHSSVLATHCHAFPWGSREDRVMFHRLDQKSGKRSQWPQVGREYRSYEHRPADGARPRVVSQLCYLLAHQTNSPRFLLFPQLWNGRNNTYFTRWWWSLNSRMYKGLSLAY